jgi:hypothetical protein
MLHNAEKDKGPEVSTNRLMQMHYDRGLHPGGVNDADGRSIGGRTEISHSYNNRLSLPAQEQNQLFYSLNYCT